MVSQTLRAGFSYLQVLLFMKSNLTVAGTILIIILLQLFVALFNDGFVLIHDEAMWQYIGRNWFRNGLVPYTGGIDNKSPLIFFIFGLSDWLAGVNYWIPRLLGTVAEAIGIYYLFKIANYYAGRKAGIIAITLYGLSLLWRSTGGKLVSFTETYATLFIILSFYHYLTAQNSRKYFISGLLAGLGCGFRLSALFGTTAILVACFKRDFLSAILFIAGWLTALAALVLLAGAAGIHLNDLVYYTFSDNFGAGSTTDHSLVWKLESFFNGFFYSEIVLFYPFIAAYFFIKREIDAPGWWLIFTVIGISAIGIYAHPHFKEVLPAFSLTSAIAIVYLVNEYNIPFKPTVWIIWICFFPKFLEPIVALKKLISGKKQHLEAICQAQQSNEEAEKELGIWIKYHTDKKALVYVAGYGARVQAYSERMSPTIFFNVTQTKGAKERLYKDLSNNNPQLILIPAFTNYNQFVQPDIRKFIENMVSKEYTFQQCIYGYGIYRRK